MKKVLGYCVPWSVAPGDFLAVKVSVESGAAYTSRLVRVLGPDPLGEGNSRDCRPVDHPSNGRHDGRAQRTPVGSFMQACQPGALHGLRGLTLGLYAQVTLLTDGRQTLISNWDQGLGSGFALSVLADGRLAFRVGNNRATTEIISGRPVQTRCWFLVSAAFDGVNGCQSIHVEHMDPQFEVNFSSSTLGSTSLECIGDSALPLLIAATPDPSGGRWHTEHFNGKIERPFVCSRWLDADVIKTLATNPDASLWGEAVIGLWDFSTEIDSDIARDISGNERHGRLVNLPSRGVKGHTWCGEVQSWKLAPAQYAAVHFHDDDLYDAGWDTDFTLEIPESLPSGFYALLLQADGDETYLPFFVRPPKGRSNSTLVFLAPTATYMAYANYRFSFEVDYNESLLGHLLTLNAESMQILTDKGLGLSTYDTHSDGSGVRYSSRLRPVVNTGPGSELWNYAADTHILQWLDQLGVSVDVITDEDLHREGASVLQHYQCLITGTHPEYWTSGMWGALQKWQTSGGRLMYLGGNGFYWNTAMAPRWPGAMEVRRAEGGSRYWAEEPGEYYMAWTGCLGGLTRRTGNPPHRLVGVGTRAIGFQTPGWYERTASSYDPRVRFIFEGVAHDEIIGNFGTCGAAAGEELDAADEALGTPKHALVVAASKGHGADLMAVSEDILMPNPTDSAAFNDRLRAEMVFFETPHGGAVFSVGSIQWAASLAHNNFSNNVARISTNVLRRFLLPDPFLPPQSPNPTP